MITDGRRSRGDRLRRALSVILDLHPRLTFGLLTVLIVMFAAAYWATVARTPGLVGRYAAIDYRLYMDATSHWLSTGTFYAPWQTSGTYNLLDAQGDATGAILYPPFSLYLFAPFTVLPAFLWWLLPLGATAAVLWRLRPSPLAWPVMALCLWYPTSGLKILTGNPTIWVLAATALGTLYAWPSVGVLIKPSLFPFALIGIKNRRWWLALAVLGVMSLPFGLLWHQWIVALLNAKGGGVLYSVQEIPLLCLPLAARIGRTSGPAQPLRLMVPPG